jgi:DNA mismatch repair protein MutH
MEVTRLRAEADSGTAEKWPGRRGSRVGRLRSRDGGGAYGQRSPGSGAKLARSKTSLQRHTVTDSGQHVRMDDSDSFPYRTATSVEIAARGSGLVGRRLDALSQNPVLRGPSSATTKGIVGRIYEAYFGIEPNQRPEPDFVGAGIELKSVPILLAGAEARAKERVSLGMIDWRSLPDESWETALARRKLEHLMLIFYEWSPLRPIGYFKTLVAGLWKPDDETLAALEQDWMTIQRLAIEGRIHEASESLTTSLGAATKGAGHGSKTRAWSLKQPFVGWIYRAMSGSATVSPTRLPKDPEGEFEAVTLARLESIEGQTIAAVAASLGRQVGRGKSAAADVIRALVGQKAKGRIGDFDRFGVELKTLPIDRRGRPVERTSFPAFVHEELAFETWEASDLLGRLNRILFVPLYRDKGQEQATAVVRPAFFWSPTETELVGISEEWSRICDLILAHKSRDLPKESQTRFIHVRTHGRNSRDQEPAPGGFDVTRKSFWLNLDYVETIIREHGSPSR